MRILVTGANGFIGRHVVQKLVEKKHEVFALTRGSESNHWNNNCTYVQADLTQASKMKEVLRKISPEACIHLAWYAEPGEYLTSPLNVDMISASLKLIHQLSEVGCKYITISGTCAEYDANYGYLKEETPIKPETLYASCKHALHVAGEQLAQQLGMGFSLGRVFFPYGPRENPKRAVPGVIQSLLKENSFGATEGMQVRDYIYVEDIASAFVCLIEKQANGCFNISSGQPVTMRSLMETIEGIIGRSGLIHYGEIPYRHWDPMFICGSNDKLKGIGWSPGYSLKEGLAQTIEYWKNHVESSSS